MRIICPNCDAQYEVPDEVVPQEGRDVQCSNCGTTWYLNHPSSPAAVHQDDAGPAPRLVQDAPGADEDYQETSPQSAADAGPQPQQMDPEVEAILRKEAEREKAARDAEATPALEVQEDLGLQQQSEDEATRRTREARERMSRMRGEEVGDGSDETPMENVGEAAATAAAVGSRREMLPDIEEINSTLRSTNDREVAGDDPHPEAPVRGYRRRGFRRGVSVAIILFALALLVYIFAPQISRAVPALASALDGYVSWVDGLRLTIDDRMQGVLRWLDSKAAASGN